MVKAKALWITSKRNCCIQQVSLDKSADNDILIKSLYSGISRGTESLVFNGSVPASEHSRMQAPFQQGDFGFPIKYGYCNVGVVEDGPDNLKGKHVFCLYPHQTQYYVPAEWVHPIPETIPVRRAILAANLETAVNALWDARPALGDRITVVGAGVLGSLCAWLASQITGCEVELIDINSSKAWLGQTFGITFKQPEYASLDRDLVIHASANESGLALALQIAAKEATIVEVSWYGDRAINFPAGADFHSKRLTLRSSQVGTISPAQSSRWDNKRRMNLVMRLLNAPILDCLINKDSHFSNLATDYPNAVSAQSNTLCHCIHYD